MGKSTISMAIFNSYVSLPEGKWRQQVFRSTLFDVVQLVHLCNFGHESLWIKNINTLWLFNIAMENCPFIVDFPIKNGDFP